MAEENQFDPNEEVTEELAERTEDMPDQEAEQAFEDGAAAQYNPPELVRQAEAPGPEFVVNYLVINKVANGFTMQVEWKRNPDVPAPVMYGPPGAAMQPYPMEPHFKQPETMIYTTLDDLKADLALVLG